MSNRKWIDRLQVTIGGIILDDNSLITEKGTVIITMTNQVMIVNLNEIQSSKTLGKLRMNDPEGSFEFIVQKWREI